MALGFKFSMFPEFQPGETVLHFRKRLWLVSGKSLPSYRISIGLPPFMDYALYVTDRRVLFAGHVFGVLNQEFSLWFPGRVPEGPQEALKSCTTGRARLGGTYLELVSEDPKEHWYRSHEGRIRIYMRNPEALERSICKVTTIIPTGAMKEDKPSEIKNADKYPPNYEHDRC